MTQAECAALGSPLLLRAPLQRRPGARELRPPAGFTPPSHRQSQSPTATLGQALGWDFFLCPRAGLQRPLLIIFDLDSPRCLALEGGSTLRCSGHPCRLRQALLALDSPNGTVSVSASVSPTEQQQQLKFLYTTPHPAPGWREY